MIQKSKRGFALFESPPWSLLVKPESELNRKTRQFFADILESTRLVKHKNPKANLKLQYKKVFELSLALTLVLLLAMFQLGRQYSLASVPSSKNVAIQIEVADIPATKQYRRLPPPTRPGVPVPTGLDAIPEDVTIPPTEIDLSDIPPPPAPSIEYGDEQPIFVAYDKAPQVIGGLDEIQKHLKYPKTARKAGTEGTVYVRVLVGVDGRVEKMEIIKAEPDNNGFERAAMAAVKKVKWEPAEQHDKKVRVWATIPVRFKIS